VFGLIVLGHQIHPAQWVGIAAVIAASVASRA
jgi:threonine/homoserine efflux transporter RhtA